MSTRRRSSLLIPSFPLPALPLPESPELPRQPPRIIQDDLEDAPPPSILHARTAPEHSPDPPRDSTDLSRDQLQPEPRIPSSRRTLTRALELAREAVQLDSTNEEPQAVVMAYGRSVALLSEVMERVRRGEDSTDPSSPRHKGRPRSAVAQEEEVRRLQNIHDTYVDRMNILSAIYNIPPVPYSTTNEYIQITSQSDQQQAQASSPTGFLSPTSDRSDPIPTSDAYTAPYPDEHEQDPGHDRDPTTEADMFPFDPSRSGLPPVSYPYPAAQYEEPPAPAPRPRRPRNTPAAALALPSPPPANSLPPPPLYEPASLATSIIYWPDDTTGVSEFCPQTYCRSGKIYEGPSERRGFCVSSPTVETIGLAGTQLRSPPFGAHSEDRSTQWPDPDAVVSGSFCARYFRATPRSKDGRISSSTR
ncbi:hypothetical protein DFH07DRAFT_482765 [Mycena maculata]|uniref:MIT domain-containing protein n=1 Tax=Mycena maculata TaxID=230809 RepID=A0AAD7J365_9AGAR|nr:hypothetical protein DFH07DRAFT_482765 [Mycena maculata]